MTYHKFVCPGCHKEINIPRNWPFKLCDRCGRPHCVFEAGPCKTGTCAGWLRETRTPD